MPSALIVEIEEPWPEPSGHPGRIVLTPTDGAPRRSLVRVSVSDGRTEPLAPEPPYREASDARALDGGAWRYLQWRDDESADTVLHDGRGARSVRAGGMGRHPALGGYFTDRRAPVTDDGRFAVIASEHEGEPWSVVEVSSGAEILDVPIIGRPSVFLREDGGAVLACAARGDAVEVALAVRGAVPVRTTIAGGRRCVAANRDLSRLIIVRGGADERLEVHASRGDLPIVPLGEVGESAFDRCGANVFVASSAADGTTALRVASLEDGTTRALAELGDVWSIAVTREGWVLAVALPWESEHSDSSGRAWLVPPDGGPPREIALPPHAALVTAIP
ncbi:MAG: hypothetical protein M3Y87_10735 [Myxococcota bacterium]|nr:hypothetical protein [Myxococcota bacterium]